jgi:FixJ family two-component response regulator
MHTSLHVLIVEDSEYAARLVGIELQRCGYEAIIERVQTAKEMQQALDDHLWDVIILDYIMPLFSGSEALQLLKENQSDIPCIVLSGAIGEELAVSAMKDGAHDYVMKGNVRRLVPIIERELREVAKRREQQRVQQETQKREALYRSIIDHQFEPLCRWLPSGTIVFANQSWYRWFGYEPTIHPLPTLWSLLVYPDKDTFVDMIHKLTPERPSVLFENTLLQASGEPIRQPWNHRALFTEEGVLWMIQSIGYLLDVEHSTQD